MNSLSDLNKDKIFGYLKSEELIYKLNQESNIIGRDTDSTIVLNHPSISKKHARIDFDIQTNNGFLIDLNSTHGTFINNMKLNPNESIKLNSGDVISFGQSDEKYIYQQKNELLISNNNDFGFQIKDNKISLVNDNDYESASINHLNGMNFKLNSFNPNNLNDLDNKKEEEINYKNNNLFNSGKNNEINNVYEDDDIKEEINSQDNFKFGQNQMTEIIEETNPEIQSNTLQLSSNNNNFQPKINNNKSRVSNNLSNINSYSQKNNNINNSQKNSLYNELYNKNKLLEIELKGKNNEIKNLSDIYNTLKDNYNKLNAKHNALMIYASDIQKKNDVLELEIQNKESKISENIRNNDESNINKILLEKDSLISHLEEENQLYKEQLDKIKQRLLGEGGPNNLENQNISNLIDKLNNELLSEIIKYKQIINKYLSYETTCSRKWNELLLTNDTLKEKVASLSNNWNDDIKKYNNILRNNDIRLQSALEKVSDKISGGFDIKKEEAAKYLVEQMNIVLGEKNHLLQTNSILTKKNTELEIENNKLKKEITELEIEKRNGDNKALLAKIDELKDVIKKKDIMYEPEKIINYQNIILELDIKNKQKDKLIREYKNKMDNFLKNNTFLNFDDREVVNSVSKVLNQKDQVIQSLKNKIIDNEINNEINNEF